MIKMFQKKDYIYSETMGVCKVADVTNLAPKKGNAVAYYVLRSVYQKDKTAYIPVEHHTVELRELITPEEAMKLSEDAQRKLKEHPWYGNIRELEHAVEKAVIICDDVTISYNVFHFIHFQTSCPITIYTFD